MKVISKYIIEPERISQNIPAPARTTLKPLGSEIQLEISKAYKIQKKVMKFQLPQGSSVSKTKIYVKTFTPSNYTLMLMRQLTLEEEFAYLKTALKEHLNVWMCKKVKITNAYYIT